jgi:hypothetical protein
MTGSSSVGEILLLNAPSRSLTSLRVAEILLAAMGTCKGGAGGNLRALQNRGDSFTKTNEPTNVELVGRVMLIRGGTFPGQNFGVGIREVTSITGVSGIVLEILRERTALNRLAEGMLLQYSSTSC